MPNMELFEDKLSERLGPDLSAKQLAEMMVVSALETEYGKSFTLSRGFAKMVSALADVIVTNPELRRQALAVASVYARKNRDNSQKDLGKRT